jgi:hypothetical protein
VCFASGIFQRKVFHRALTYPREHKNDALGKLHTTSVSVAVH